MKKMIVISMLGLMSASANAESEVTLRQLAGWFTSTDDLVAKTYLVAAVNSSIWTLIGVGQCIEQSSDITPLLIAGELFRPSFVAQFGDQRADMMISIVVMDACGVDFDEPEQRRERRRNRA